VAGWTRAYRTPLALTAVLGALLLLFAVTPDPGSSDASAADPTSEPTAGPRCVVCPIDQRCDPDTGRCEFIDHTPWPCVESARFDEGADQCLPEGAPPAPAAVATAEPGRIPGPAFPPGIRDDDVGPDLPAIGD
jgi:hypothetical protein